MQTRKRSLLHSSPVLTPDVSLSSVDPSTLLLEPNLLTPESSSASTPDPTDEPPKKRRVRKNAKTEEEKAARAEERAVRNRRAAQESRDRKKRQFEVLERDNEQLRLENKLLRDRLSALEERLNLMESDVKLESEGNLDGPEQQLEGATQTHYPAAVMSCDLQCQVLPPTSISPSSCPHPISTSKLNPTKRISSTYSAPQNKPPPYRLPSTNSFNFPLPPAMYSLQMAWARWNLQFESCATFHSLNTGSLDTGAETTIEEAYGSGICSECVTATVLELEASREGSHGYGYMGDSNLSVKIPSILSRESCIPQCVSFGRSIAYAPTLIVYVVPTPRYSESKSRHH